jgi:peptidylprolyl isomerase
MQELQIIDTKIGTGEAVKKGDSISIHYTGTLEDGKVFDSSLDRGQPFQCDIGVGQLIAGWDIGIIDMKVGGERKLIIPSHLAYGQGGIPGAIPGGATLIFEVKLVDIHN